MLGGAGSPLSPGASGHGATAIHLSLAAWTLALIGGGEARAARRVNVYAEGKPDGVGGRPLQEEGVSWSVRPQGQSCPAGGLVAKRA